jgi:hypothetical protein
LGITLVDFRAAVMDTVKARWFPALVVTLTAQAIFFLALVLSTSFMSVNTEQASVSNIVGTSGNTELATAVTAGAFVHRIFT